MSLGTKPASTAAREAPTKGGKLSFLSPMIQLVGISLIIIKKKTTKNPNADTGQLKIYFIKVLRYQFLPLSSPFISQ